MPILGSLIVALLDPSRAIESSDIQPPPPSACFSSAAQELADEESAVSPRRKILSATISPPGKKK